jgi:hypothetical protein
MFKIKIKTWIVLSISICLLNSCNTGGVTVSFGPATNACFRILPDSYVYGVHQIQIPTLYVIAGTGMIKTSVTGNNSALFIQMTKFTHDRWSQQIPVMTSTNTPIVVSLNGTPNSGLQDIVTGPSPSSPTQWITNLLGIDVPPNDGYTVKFLFIEFGATSPSPSPTGLMSPQLINCPNPAPNTCHNWSKMISFPAGTLPRCDNQPFGVIINQYVTGSCN